MTRLAAALSFLLLLTPRLAAAQCPPVAPVACPNCFALFVMPDTQTYTELPNQPAAGNHLDLVTRYVCDNRTNWKEPTTGKTMPIQAVIQLGDLVNDPEHSEAVLGDFAQWQRIDAAFDNLDACNVPYVVTNGNHDQKSFHYERLSTGYGMFFGSDRWANAGVACSAPDSCDWDAGQYFLGIGDTIAAGSRNNDNSGGGSPGPSVSQLGRHRAGLIRAPNGQPFLLLGLEQSFDFPPPAPGFEAIEADDSAWPKQLLSLYPRVATIVFHHSMLWVFPPPDSRLRWGPETWRSDSISAPPGTFEDPDFALTGGMEALYDLLIEPNPQVRFLFTGHVVIPDHQADYTITRPHGPPVWAFLRNFQGIDNGLPGDEDRYGVGWNVIAVFDPDAQEVRVRSYRIDDVENYTVPPVNHDHAGTPAATECLDTDQNGVGERVISWDFKVSGAAQTPSLSGASATFLAGLVTASAAWAIRRRTKKS